MRIFFICIVGVAATLMMFSPAGSWLQKRNRDANANVAAQLSLQAQTDGEMMRIAWNQNAAVLQKANGGVLTIRDGASSRDIALSGNELRSRGNIAYRPATSEVELRMVIGGAQISRQSESVLVVLGPGRAAAVKPAPIEAEAEVASARPAAEAPSRSAEPPARSSLIQTVSIQQGAANRISGGGYRPPEPLSEVKAALSQQLEPLVQRPVEIIVRVKIDARGRVVRARPVSQAGSLEGSTKERTLITQAVLDAARRWSFRPAQINSRTVPSEMILSFQLGKSG